MASEFGARRATIVLRKTTSVRQWLSESSYTFEGQKSFLRLRVILEAMRRRIPNPDLPGPFASAKMTQSSANSGDYVPLTVQVIPFSSSK
jgi:hypothetical protein